jgi:hypothetical protein
MSATTPILDNAPTLQGWLTSFGRATGLADLRLDHDSRCAVRTATELVVVAELAKNGDDLFFYAKVGMSPDTNREIFYRRLLVINFMLLETRGATLCVDDAEDDVLLVERMVMDELDEHSFAERWAVFIETSQKMAARLAGESDAPGVESTSVPAIGFQV